MESMRNVCFTGMILLRCKIPPTPTVPSRGLIREDAQDNELLVAVNILILSTSNNLHPFIYCQYWTTNIASLAI